MTYIHIISGRISKDNIKISARKFSFDQDVTHTRSYYGMQLSVVVLCIAKYDN